MVTRFLLTILAICLYHVKLHSQDIVTEGSFKNWYRISNAKLSDDGTWSYFLRFYDDGRKDGVLLNTISKDTFVYDSPSEVFLNNNFFVSRDKKGKLIVRNLKSSKSVIENSVEKVFVNSNYSKVFFLKNKTLNFIDNKTLNLHTLLDNVINVELLKSKVLAINQTENFAFLDTNTNIVLANLNVLENEKVLTFNYNFKDKEATILSKIGDAFKLKSIKNNDLSMKEKDVTSIFQYFSSFSFFDDFNILATKPSNVNQNSLDEIEEWNTTDKGIKPLINKYKKTNFDAVLYNCNNENFKVSIPQEQVTRRFFVFDNNYLFEILDLENEDFTNEHLIPKIQLRNTNDNKVEWSSNASNDYFVFEKDKSIYYFYDGNWWVYNALQKESTNITAKSKEKFYYYSRQSLKFKHPIDSPIFSYDFSKLYFTGENNIWEYSIVKKTFVNITQNDDINKSYKIQNFYNAPIQKLKWKEVNLLPNSQIVLKVKTNDEFLEGLAIYNQGKLMEIESLQGISITGVVQSNNAISYSLENANNPYKLKIYQLKTAESKVLFNSNEENYLEKEFPKTVTISWNEMLGKTNFTDEKNYVTVILPPNYNPNIKYPAIIHIYENKAKEYRDFVYPTFFNQSGFNRTFFALNDYIVILPMIKYSINEPGDSALLWVEKAIEKVKEFYKIDTDKLGIIGESFGGFETNYIIAHTNKFKVAVSGVSISDVTASYFSYNTNFLRPNIWRYTDQCFRFSDDFFKLKEVYLNNNPVFSADKINTPLLLWTGKEDYHVNWNQSVAMYIALASLKKNVKLLLFPKDGHSLQIQKNQFQATSQIFNWFNHYLKEN